MSRACLLLVFSSSLIATSSGRADDLRSLSAKYRAAARQAAGSPRDRAARVRQHVSPVLDEIAALDSDESLAFLLGELNKAPVAEISAACASPILRSSRERVVLLLLGGFSRRPAVVQRAVLQALAKTKKSLEPARAELLAAARGKLAPEVRSALPGALARLNDLDAAKALLASVRSPRSRSRPSGAGSYRDAVVGALRKTTAREVREWFGDEAFSAAGSDPDRLVVVARLAGEFRRPAAREHLAKLLVNKTAAVASAAVDALARIGIGSSGAAIARALERRRGPSGLRFRVQAMDALAASGDAEALGVVLRLARASDAETRAVAMGSLALAASEPAAIDALVAGLADRTPDVRSVALRAVSRVRDKRVVRPLIEALASEDYAYRVRVLRLLVRLTGQNMGLVVADWKKWWEIAEARFEFPKEGSREFTSVKAYGLDYFGIEVASKRLGFIVDISSSMTQTVKVRTRRREEGGGARGRTVSRGGGKGGGEAEGKARKIDVLKKELARVIRKLPADTQINIVCFDANYRAWQKQLQPIAGAGRSRALRYVEALNTGHGTNVFDTLEFALQDRRVDTIYLLTDGQPTRGRITDPAAIRDEIRKLNRLRAVTIHCIAFGEESAFLEKLAGENGGQYRFVDEY